MSFEAQNVSKSFVAVIALYIVPTTLASETTAYLQTKIPKVPVS